MQNIRLPLEIKNELFALNIIVTEGNRILVDDDLKAIEIINDKIIYNYCLKD